MVKMAKKCPAQIKFATRRSICSCDSLECPILAWDMSKSSLDSCSSNDTLPGLLQLLQWQDMAIWKSRQFEVRTLYIVGSRILTGSKGSSGRRAVARCRNLWHPQRRINLIDRCQCTETWWSNRGACYDNLYGDSRDSSPLAWCIRLWWCCSRRI